EDLESLGMQKEEQDRFTNAINRPNGAVLVTGPTGSGKSTTLYTALNALNDGERSILTIEDPVEQRIVGIKQMQIATKAGVTFEVGLRSMLRADPDGAAPYEPVGCSRCSGSGYRGRVGLYEVMSVSEPIRALILERASIDE